MATIGNDANGRKRILFVAVDGKRRTIRLGQATMKQAEAFKLRVEQLVSATITGVMDDELSRWVADRDDETHTKLAKVGLVKPRSRANMALGAFLTELFATLDVKPNTLRNYTQARTCLEEYFTVNKPLRDITAMDGDQYRTWLRGTKKLSDATIAKWIIIARQMFKRAAKWKLVAENPFADVKAGSQKNKARMFFVTRDMAQAVLDACPDSEWKLLFALSRYGGLRCPSEHLALKWADIDWEHNRILVHSPKTEHHDGGESRLIPLFPELRPYLLEAFEGAEPGTEDVITRYRDTRQNLRTQLCRIVKRAGLKPWPKPWHNLRSTRQTELAEDYPGHVVCAWLGNSEAVARQHYLQITDTHYERAVQNPTPIPPGNGEAQARGGEGAAQNPAQYTAGTASKHQELVGCTNEKGSDLPSLTNHNSLIHNEKRSRQESNL